MNDLVQSLSTYSSVFLFKMHLSKTQQILLLLLADNDHLSFVSPFWIVSTLVRKQ